MAAYFFDSSATVKRYIGETGTAWILAVTDPRAGNRLYVTRITGVETVSAIARRGRGGSLTAQETAVALSDFRFDFAQAYNVLEVGPVVIARAMSLAEVHALRGYDAIQLAAALEINDQHLALSAPAVTFVCADAALNATAILEGLTVDDPNAQP